jgi:hypothetical protein
VNLWLSLICLLPHPPPHCPSSGQKKNIFTTVYITEPHRQRISQHFIIIPVAFFKESKGTVSQDFSKTYSYFKTNAAVNKTNAAVM